LFQCSSEIGGREKHCVCARVGAYARTRTYVHTCNVCVCVCFSKITGTLEQDGKNPYSIRPSGVPVLLEQTGTGGTRFLGRF
jgi:hypothetical protein